MRNVRINSMLFYSPSLEGVSGQVGLARDAAHVPGGRLGAERGTRGHGDLVGAVLRASMRGRGKKGVSIHSKNPF